MAVYADKEFYMQSWGGNIIPDDDIGKYLRKASMEVDTLTFGRLRKGLPDEEYAVERVRMAVCSAADLIYESDLAEKQALQAVGQAASKDVSERDIKSVSDGTESITYSSGNELVSQAKGLSAVFSGTGKERRKLINSEIRRYLSGVTGKDGVCLLYAGI